MENRNELKRGDKVEVNGNKEGRILDKYMDGVWIVRLWSGKRLIGDCVANENDIKRIG